MKKMENGLVMINFLQVHRDKGFMVKSKGLEKSLNDYRFNWTSLEEWIFEYENRKITHEDVEEIIERNGKLVLRPSGTGGIIRICIKC